MDSLLALFSSPTAAQAVSAVGRAATAVVRPFADVLGALAARHDHGAEPVARPHEAESRTLVDRIRGRIEQLLAEAGVDPGDCASVGFDPETNRVSVDHFSPLSGDVDSLIEADAKLMSDLQELSALESANGESTELLIEMGAA